MRATLLYRASRVFYRTALLPCLRFKVGGLEHVPLTGGLILASNHQSYLDPILLGSGSPRVPVHFMARASLFESRILGLYFRNTHTFGVKRGGADRQAWQHFEDLVRSGEQVSFFPEGTRSPDGRLGEGNIGSGMLIHRCAGAAVVPARIRGTWKVLNKDRGFGGLHAVSLAFGPPVDLAGEYAQKGGREVYTAITAKVMAAIAAVAAVDGRDDDADAALARGKNSTMA